MGGVVSDRLPILERMFDVAWYFRTPDRYEVEGWPTGAAHTLQRAEQRAPGPEVIRLLARIDPAALEEPDRVRYLLCWEKASRWVAAQQARAVAAAAGDYARRGQDWGREEVRAALREVGGSPRGWVDLARMLVHGPLTGVLAGLESGRLSWEHARAIGNETFSLDAATAAAVAAAVIDRAPDRTPAQFRTLVKKAVIDADPLRAELAAQRAAKARRVWKQAEDDGQASLGLTGPALDVHTVWTFLDAHAAIKEKDDQRTVDQRRFDALVALCRAALGSTDLAGKTRRGLPLQVFVFADAPTWAGLTDGAVELAGYGPIPAGVARAAFTDARWRALVTDTLTGLPLAVSDRTYRPSAATRRLLFVKDRACRFPGCHAAVWFCDADHGRPHDQGGCTDPDNCGLLCRRHHRLKTFTPWRWKRQPDGTIQWTDPHGWTWNTEPIRYYLPHPQPQPQPEPQPPPPPYNPADDPPPF